MFRVKKRETLQSNDPLVYELVELRRQQFDGMIWQVPALTFAGQAFLFSVLLGSDTAPWARIAAGVFSVGISYLSLMLLARHRQAEEAASQWLHQYEVQHGWPPSDYQHGREWAKRRNALIPGVANAKPSRRTGWGRVPLANGFKTWVVALYLLMIISVVSTVIGVLGDFGALDLNVAGPSDGPSPSLRAETPAPTMTVDAPTDAPAE